MFTEKAHKFEVESSDRADVDESDLYDLKDKDIHIMNVELYPTQGPISIKHKPVYKVINVDEFEVKYNPVQYILGTKYVV